MSRRAVWTVAGVVAIIGFVAFGAGAFKSNLTPYVSFQQARATKDAVQVAGKLVPGSDSFEEASSRLVFAIQDAHGDVMKVAYKGLKPGNFHDATQVVAIGRFQGGLFEAEKLLVKCPSKYQGVEEKEYRSSSS
jgi:cytochrome c-type biogenesis protein CcmE